MTNTIEASGKETAYHRVSAEDGYGYVHAIIAFKAVLPVAQAAPSRFPIY